MVELSSVLPLPTTTNGRVALYYKAFAMETIVDNLQVYINQGGSKNVSWKEQFYVIPVVNSTLVGLIRVSHSAVYAVVKDKGKRPLVDKL